MARFIFKGAPYDLVDINDVDFDEAAAIEEVTGSDILNGKVSLYGLVWISIRRKFPTTTWDDIKHEKPFQLEWLKDDDEEERLPPTSNGANGSSTVDAPTELLAPTDTGTPG